MPGCVLTENKHFDELREYHNCDPAQKRARNTSCFSTRAWGAGSSAVKRMSPATMNGRRTVSPHTRLLVRLLTQRCPLARSNTGRRMTRVLAPKMPTLDVARSRLDWSRANPGRVELAVRLWIVTAPFLKGTRNHVPMATRATWRDNFPSGNRSHAPAGIDRRATVEVYVNPMTETSTWLKHCRKIDENVAVGLDQRTSGMGGRYTRTFVYRPCARVGGECADTGRGDQDPALLQAAEGLARRLLARVQRDVGQARGHGAVHFLELIF